MNVVNQYRLDYIRGIAALYVVVNHVRGTFFAGGSRILSEDPSIYNHITVYALQFTSLGAEAVVLFFVLSGFAMAHSMRNTQNVNKFYLKRIIRIWPPYIAATILAFMVSFAIGTTDIRDRFFEVIFYIDPATSLTPQFWSVPYEVVFYLICPFVIPYPKILFATAILLTAIMVTFLGIDLNPSSSFIMNFGGNELLLFSIGVIFYKYMNHFPNISPKFLMAASALILICVIFTKLVIGSSNLVSNMFMALLAVILIGNLPRLPFNFGRFSYSIYIYHIAFMSLIAWLIKPWIIAGDIRNPVAWMLVIPPIIGGCYLLYLVTERPCNLLVGRLRREGNVPGTD